MIVLKIKTFMDFYKNWLMGRRYETFRQIWNMDIILIENIIKLTNRGFYWGQLILEQEIKMFIRLGEKVSLKEFNELCERRGFSLIEKDYLKFLLSKVGLF